MFEKDREPWLTYVELGKSPRLHADRPTHATPGGGSDQAIADDQQVEQPRLDQCKTSSVANSAREAVRLYARDRLAGL